MSEETIGEYAARCKEAMIVLSPDTWSDAEKAKIDKYIGKIIDVYYKKNDGNMEAAETDFEKYIKDVEVLAEKSKLIAERKAEMAKAGLAVEEDKVSKVGSINGIHDLADRIKDTKGGELFGYSELLGMVGVKGLSEKLKSLANMDFMIARVSPEHEGIVFTGMAKGITALGDVLEKLGVPVDTTQMAELKERVVNSEALGKFKETVDRVTNNIPLPDKAKFALEKVRDVMSTASQGMSGSVPAREHSRTLGA